MNNINQCKQWLETHRDLFSDLVRIYLGTGLVVKALYLMIHRSDLLIPLVEQSSNRWFAPVVVAHYVVLSHLAGGVLLALGLLTRVAAAVQIPNLIGAVLYLYLPRMMSIEHRLDFEFAALVLFLLILFTVFGAGRYSIDSYLENRGPASSNSPQVATSGAKTG